MDSILFPPAGLFIIPLVAIQIAWYVGVIVLLYRIWKKVKHLPG